MSTEDLDLDTDPTLTVSGIPSTETVLGKLIFIVGIAFSLLTILYIHSGFLRVSRMLNLHIGLGFFLFALIYIHRQGDYSTWTLKNKLLVSLVVLITGIVLISVIYVELNYNVLRNVRFRGYPTFEVWFVGLGLVVGAIALMYFAYGPVLPLVTLFGVAYALFGPQFPGVLNHSGTTLSNLIVYNTLKLQAGVYHIIVRVGATWVFIFLIWAGIVEELGGIKALIDIGRLIGGHFRSGPAQTAVVSSMIMGSINGSPMANSVVTGSFTIPLMKQQGLSGRTAAAIESVASTGGMILPPVMGATAFLMASFLNQTYGEIIIAAALPSILFIIATALSVHLISLKEVDSAAVEHDIDLRQIVLPLSSVFVSLVYLVYVLLIEEASPGIAGLQTIFVLVGAETVKRLILADNRIETMRELIVVILKGLRTGGYRQSEFTVVLAGVGILISSFAITSVGFRLSSAIVDISAGSIFVLLGLVMVVCIFLGMGMPTVAAYLLVITLIAPAMVQVGFADITAHFFVFYFAILATITPPVALVCAVTCKIAGEEFLPVAITSAKLGIPLFVIPFVFAFNQSLLTLEGIQTVKTLIVTGLAMVLIVLGIHGMPKGMFSREVSIGLRIVTVPISIFLIFII